MASGNAVAAVTAVVSALAPCTTLDAVAVAGSTAKYIAAGSLSTTV